MDNMMKVFNNSEFGEVRVHREGDKVLFSGTDVARALGYSNPHDAIRRHCKGVVKREGVSLTTNQHGTETQQTSVMSFLCEGDVYRLIAHSKLPSAEKFERWVFDEVLPSIRATGVYMTDDAIAKFLADPDATIKLMVAYRDTAKALTAETQAHGETKMLLAERDATIKENEPKVLFADAVADSDGCISIGELAKIIAQNGVDIGRNRLFKLLRDDGYLMCGMTEDFNTPTQKSIRHGWMRVKESTYYQGNNRCIQKTPRITGKGQLYFVNKYAKKVG